MTNEATLYRDAEYGALGIFKAPRGVVVVDHAFTASDFERVLEVLERHGQDAGEAANGHGVLWKLKSPTPVVLSNIETALKLNGYGVDPLGSRTIRQVPVEEAIKPDLPAARPAAVREAVERALRQHADIAFSVLGTLGKVHEGGIEFFPRPNMRDMLQRPLPFLRARGLITCGDPTLAQRELRETLAALGPALVRASVEETKVKGVNAVEFAISPSEAACDAFLSAVLPTFGATRIEGVRLVEIALKAALPEEARKFLEAQAVASTGALSVRSADGRTITARVPSARISDPIADSAFRARLAWLVEKLAEYEPEVTEVSSVEEVSEIVREDREVYGSGGVSQTYMADQRPVTPQELAQLERFIDALFRKAGLDVQFTKHFLDRLNDPRNGKQITIKELGLVFREVYAKFSQQIKTHGADWEALIKDVTTAINIPFVLDYDPSTGMMDLVAKTIMRKPNFMSSDPKLVVATPRA